MIAFFRRTLASKLAFGLLALVLLAFIVTGVFTREMPGATGLGGAGGDIAARAGDRRIAVPEMEDRVRRAFAQYQQGQPGLDLPRFVATGGFDAVVDQTIAAAALEAYAGRLGLAASRRQVDGEIAGVRAFQGPTGRFDEQAYRAALAQQRISEADLRRDIGGDILRRMLYLPASGAVALPDGLIAPYANLVAETRSGTIGLVPAQAFAGGLAPSDAELRRFQQAHAAAYMLPERRVLRYAVIDRGRAAGAAPGEDEIRRVYDRSPDKFGARETRTLAQVVLPDEAAARAFAAKVKAGTSFADAAKAAGFGAADIAIGDKTQAAFAGVTSPAVAAAAFAAPEGGISAPVKSDLGWHVVKVEKATRTAATSFEAARPQIAADLVKQKQDAALAALTAKAQDALDSGQSLADVARANALTVTETPPVTQGGAAPGDAGYKPPPELATLLKPGFASAPDVPPTLETIQAGERYALLAVARVLPAAPLPFAQVRARLATDFATVRASDRAKAVAQAILAKVKAGTAIEAAFKAAPVALPAPQSGSGRRLDLSRAQNVPPSLKALFTMPAGAARLVPAGGGQGWYIVQLKTVTPADPKMLPPLIAASRQDLVQSASDEYAQQLANAAAAAVGVTRNGQALAALRQRLLGGAPAAP